MSSELETIIYNLISKTEQQKTIIKGQRQTIKEDEDCIGKLEGKLRLLQKEIRQEIRQV